MKTEVMSLDSAQAEIDKWLDFKKISPKKRESQKDAIETIVSAVCDGVLVVKEDKTLVHTLKFPTDGEAPILKLEYKPRIKVNAIHAHLNGVKASDADGRIAAYIAALTTTSKGIATAIDTEDYGIAQAIATFFL